MLIANMVARNEANRYLEEVLDHLRPIVDLIVFTDDASDDATPEIAEKYGAEVFRNEEPLFVVHEGRLRSKAWENVSKFASIDDWILSVDADEKLWSTNEHTSLPKLLGLPNHDVMNIEFRHMWNRKQYRVDKLWRPHGSSRLYRYFLGGTYLDKRLACGAEPTYVNTLIRQGRMLFDTNLVFEHLGYANEEDRKMKYARYMELDKGEFHNRAHLESILDPDPVLVDWWGDAS